MSCCGGNCGCGDGCKCGNGCGGCKMYPDLSHTETSASAAATETAVLGVTSGKINSEGGAENGCKCGANCTCEAAIHATASET